MIRDWRRAELDDSDRALCELAVKLTQEPEAMSRQDVEALRQQDFDDVAIHDAVQVVSYFNYINRIADALGVEPEAWLRPWERGGATK